MIFNFSIVSHFFWLIEFNCIVSISYKIIPYYVYYCYILIVLSTWGRKWQPMEDVKGMWYTE